MNHSHLKTLLFSLILLFTSSVAIAQTFKVRVADAEINVHFAPEAFKLPKEQILQWISFSAKAVTTYYGRFPVKYTNIYLTPSFGSGVKGGRAYGYNRTYIRVSLGQNSSWDDLLRDWVMVHEMVHLALPSLSSRHAWLYEGAAVYVESIARLQAGHLKEGPVWGSLMRGMRNGLPRAGDQGLDFTPTWGRTYWGGAIFCLVADIEIRKRTNGKKGLQDALRAVNRAGGNLGVNWPIRKIFAIGDKATGTTVLTELYNEWRAKPVDPDLPTLWRKLGLTLRGRIAVIRNDAELSRIRLQIIRSQ